MLFNSHPHKEDDELEYGLIKKDVHFQLTSSQGGWRHSQESNILQRIFQLTSSQGGWHTATWIAIIINIFQLTSSQGGWLEYSTPPDFRGIFQLTSSQGGWRCRKRLAIYHYVFNSHPHKEDDTGFLQANNPVCVFQLTSSQGGWQQF